MKKKVKELITRSILYIDRVNMGDIKEFEALVDTRYMLEQALEELSKSDWVSVENGLPPYDEEVLVCDVNAPRIWGKPWICFRSKDESYRHITDKHKFVTTHVGNITHWCKIEELED